MTPTDPTPRPPPRPTVRLPRAVTGWGPAVVAFVAVRLYLLAAAAAHGLDGSAAVTWTRWDSFQYLSIALDGYTLGTADGRHGPSPAGTPVGNAGWMPGYPLLMRLGPRVGLTPLAAGFGWSAACGLLMLRAIDGLSPPGTAAGRRSLVLVLAAFFPGFVYAHAVFPISLTVLLLAVSVRLTAGGRWAAGGLAGAGAAFCYTSGYLVGPAMGLWAVLPTGGRTGARGAAGRAARMVGPALLPVGGFAAVLALQRATLGRWDGVFTIQAQHGLGPSNPVAALARYLSFAASPDRSLAVSVWQVGVVTGLVAAVVAVTAAGWRGRPAADRLLAVAAACYWVAPLSLGAGVSPWRAMAVLAAFVPPLCRRLPAVALWGLLAAFAALGWAMCDRFLTGAAI